MTPRRARGGVSLMFFTNGVLFSALLPRYPEIKAGFGLSNTEFGLIVVAFAAGAAIGAPFGGLVIRTVGALRVTALGSVALATTMAVAGAAPVVWLFVAAMFVGGLVDSIVDAAQNVQGVVVEHWYGRSVINSLHALWSVGAAVGGAIGAAAAAADVAIGTQMLVNGSVWALVAVLSSVLSRVPADVRLDAGPGSLEPDADGVVPSSRAARRRAWRLLAPLIVLATCGVLVEDVASNWVVLFLDREAGAPVAAAALGYTVVLAAQFVGRVLGDPMTDRWGREAVARSGGVLIALGSAMAMLSPHYLVAYTGFALAGFGCATLVPAAFAAAARVPGLPEGTGIAVLGWLMRLGFLFTSPAIGSLSDSTSLSVAMVIPLGAGVLAAVVAHTVGRGARERRQPAWAGTTG